MMNASTEQRDELWRVEQVAEYLDVSEFQVWEYVSQGLPVCVLSPKVRRFVPEDVKLWVQSKSGNATKGRAVPGETDGERSKGLRVRSNRKGSRSRGGTEATATPRGCGAAIDSITK